MPFKKKLYTATLGSYRSAAYFFFNRLHPIMPKANRVEKIDIIIPVIEKDLYTLPLCLEGVHQCVENKIDKIYIVAPPQERIIDFAKQHNLCFIDENTVLGYSPKSLQITTQAGVNRSGWIFQQLLKLSGRIGENRFFIVIDSDHILLQPHTFLTEENKSVFYLSKEYYYPYYANAQKLLGFFPYQHLSYIAHKMIFDKEALSELRKNIESRSREEEKWDRIIMKSLDLKYASSFSEFELYGHTTPPNRKCRLPWKQKELYQYGKLPCYKELQQQYTPAYWSVTFPAYRKKEVTAD